MTQPIYQPTCPSVFAAYPTGLGMIFGSFSPGSDVWQLSLAQIG